MQWIDRPCGSEQSRKRVLSDDEISILWPAFETFRPNPRDILKLGLLTALRPVEIMAMRWENIDFENATVLIENTKTGNDFLQPLSSPALAILKERKNPSNYTKKTKWMIDSPWVFPTNYNQAK